ncbi:MCE family protein [Mycolicibacterium sp. YH-1]|jgi:phospholipid/cholesterol/gamma-HCH transport system substrate-binding protein|uniref:MCE family protein n=1 Tax=Mycolicibacterium sp. YH-1 TaxID=2908837 RepID=UPI001F4C45A3|nr:MCE family protein [Mycolicibacterium sp. YH-1]UNB53042.1 MCE family protein [Mycolicibacterium sp. YH-1]
MLTRFIRIQLLLFTILTIVALLVLGIYYLRLPSVVGIGQYHLSAELPRSGGLYATANVTYRGTQIGKVTSVEPTEHGARATMRIDSDIKIPADASANVHSVSAIGEQYLDIVSSDSTPGKYLSDGDTITKSSVPSEVGPALDAANKGLAVLPKEKIDALLTETSEAVGGLGPALQRLVDSTTAIASDFKDNLGPVNDIIENSTPILNSQVESGDAISQWAANLNTITSQTAEQDQALRSGIQQAAPTADQLNAVFGDVREALPQTLANIAIVADLLKRYNKGLEQALVILPQGATIAQAATIFDGEGLLHFGLSINQPPPCLTGFLPASEWRSPADTTTKPLPDGLYCKIPKDFQANVVRGARNYPCADVPGKRAASPEECRSDKPYEPLGTNPWYGDPNQILTCPAAGARCDQPVKPGYVIPAPSINNGLNPLPADQLPPKPPSPMSDPLTAPGQGTVSCSGQQPNPCVYTPASGPSAIYSPSSGEVMGPDGVTYSVTNSSNPGDNGWKEMLAPAS